jgi:hypothetical protein
MNKVLNDGLLGATVRSFVLELVVFDSHAP